MNELSDIYTNAKFVQVPIEKVKGAEHFAAGKSYPYLLFLKNGQLLADNEGLISKKRLEQFIQSMLA
jgi:hypothetical protein